MRTVATTLVVLLAWAPGLALEREPVMTAYRPGRRDGGGRRGPMKLTEVAVAVRIFGPLVETKTTMTFQNPFDNEVEGDLVFPLPDGVTVSGYGLDVRGTMVDGVAVEKAHARRAYESEVRKRIDPGLVEHVKGNDFRARVYPVAAGGSRTISLTYVGWIAAGRSARYRVPLSFRRPVPRVSLRVEVLRPQVQPVTIRSGPRGLAFRSMPDRALAEATAINAPLDDDLVIELSRAARSGVLVERAPDGEYYFAVSAIAPAAQTPPATTPKRVAIFWDASGSRAAGGHERELAVIRHLFARWKNRRVDVDLIVFRHVADAARRFAIAAGRVDELLAAIRDVDYDGGTSLGCVAPPSDRPDLCLLFTDGLTTLGTDAPAAMRSPLWVFCDRDAADHPLLSRIAADTGGRYFFLKRRAPARAAEAVGRGVYSLLGVRARGAADLLPAGRRAVVDGRVFVTGRLDADRAAVTLFYGFGLPGDVENPAGHRFTVSRRDAVEGRLVRRAWAQTRLAELALRPHRNREAIVALGKRYGLVTPHTSLIVLETLAQYLAHDIRPPASLAAMRREWDTAMTRRRASRQQRQDNAVERVLTHWEGQLAWWNTRFRFPVGFRYKPADETVVPARPPGRAYYRRHVPTRRESWGRITRLYASRRGSGSGSGGFFDDEAGGRGGFGGRASPRTPPRSADGDKSDRSAKPVTAPVLRIAAVGSPPLARLRPRPTISIEQYNPDAVYLRALGRARPDGRLAEYMRHRKDHHDQPAFYLDCSDFFLARGDRATAMRILSNIPELEPADVRLIRILAHRLADIGELNAVAGALDRAIELDPDAARGYRDLALVLARRAKSRSKPAARADYLQAIELLGQVLRKQTDTRLANMLILAVTDVNAVFRDARAAGVSRRDFPLDKRLIDPLDVDLRIVLSWDTDETVVDLHVIEPSGEEVHMRHPRSRIGGRLMEQFTHTAGPQEYALKEAMPGIYRIKVKYFTSRPAKVFGGVTAWVDIYTNFARRDQTHKRIRLRLIDKPQTLDVAAVRF